ncbi:MAG TPA: M56 family metallopeptidase [Verrucomicrobiales bacterium]|nr:M56 family metallopeptidase [Verrucomicrobiales bacterium]
MNAIAEWVELLRYDLGSWGWLGSSALKSTMWLGLALLLIAAAGRRSAAFRHVLGVAAALGIPVIFVLNLSPIPESAGWNPWLQSKAALMVKPVERIAETTGDPATHSVDFPGRKVEQRRSWIPFARLLAFEIWFCGVLVGLSLATLSLLRKPSPRGAVWRACASARIHRVLRAECRGFGWRRLPRIWLVQGSMPGVHRVLRPRVILPPEATGWEDSRLRDVLRHEAAHLARRDLTWQAVVLLALLLVWFHPLAWVLRRRLEISREEACDDAVLRAGSAGPDYADHLLALAGNGLGYRRSRQVLAAPASAVGERIRRVLCVNKVNRNPVSRTGALATGCVGLSAAAALGLLIGCETAQPAHAPLQIGREELPPIAPVRGGGGQYDILIQFSKRSVRPEQIQELPLLQKAAEGSVELLTPEEGWRYFFSQDIRGLDILTMPSVSEAPGKLVTNQVIRELVYPKSWDPGAGEYPPTPTAFDTTWTGVQASVTVQRGVSGNRVPLELQGEVRELEGFEGGEKGMPMPVIASRSLHRKGTFPNGSVFVLGTMEDEQNISDQTPVLGDIPVLGKLFRREWTDKRIGIIVMRVVVRDRE